jgi:GNAT superfamily N-acetyltransferase
MNLRAATGSDVEAMCDIFFASYNDLHRRHGMPEEDPADRSWLADAIRHVLRTDPNGTMLAIDDGSPIAFATSYLRDSYWFLSFLFVSPDAQGRGVGKTVLDAVLPPERDGLTRALVVESFQPISTGLYAGHGITPRGVRYVLTGLTDPARLPESGTGIEVADVTTDAIAEMSDLDRRQLGFARPADHEWWLRSEMTARAYRHRGAFVGYAYVDEGEIVGPALGEDEQTACAIVTDLIRRAGHPEALKVPVYGNNAELFRMLVRAGARIEPSDFRYFYCSTDDALPPTYIHYAGYMA